MLENILMGRERGQVIIWTFLAFVPAVQTNQAHSQRASQKAAALLKAGALCAISSIEISLTLVQEVVGNGGILLLFFSSPNALISLYHFIWTLFAIKAILNIALKKIIVLSELQSLSFAEAEIDWDKKKFFSPHSWRTEFSIFWTDRDLGFVLLPCSLHLPRTAQ